MVQDTSAETLAARLRWVRQELAGISARELDRLARRTEGHASLIESRPNAGAEMGTVEAYASVFGLSLDWLVRGAGRAPSKATVVAAVEAARRAAAEPVAKVG